MSNKNLEKAHIEKHNCPECKAKKSISIHFSEMDADNNQVIEAKPCTKCGCKCDRLMIEHLTGMRIMTPAKEHLMEELRDGYFEFTERDNDEIEEEEIPFTEIPDIMDSFSKAQLNTVLGKLKQDIEANSITLDEVIYISKDTIYELIDKLINNALP